MWRCARDRGKDTPFPLRSLATSVSVDEYRKQPSGWAVLTDGAVQNVVRIVVATSLTNTEVKHDASPWPRYVPWLWWQNRK